MNPGKIHRKQFSRLLSEMGEPLTVRQPAARVLPGSDRDKVMGRKDTEYTYGDEQDVTVLWRNGNGKMLDHVSTPPTFSVLGKEGNVDAIVRCLLSDVLVDTTNKQSRTIFDTAKDVSYNGNTFKVMVTDRSGMPLEGPYICWVALKKVE